MRKIILQLIAIIVLPLMVTAGQEDRVQVTGGHAPKSLRITNPAAANQTNALFDLEYNHSLGRGGFAAVTWLNGSNYWVSKWAADSLFMADTATGALSTAFFVPGLTGVRGMTFDGTFVYAANNSDTIYKIDTLTKTVAGTIIAPLAVRGIAWDSLNNFFWVGNFNTDIVQINAAGITQTTISAATHGLTGMYSIAYDPYTTGGPYIWAYDQGAGGTSQNLVRIPVATGVPNLSHNCNLELANSGISGGLSISGWSGSAHRLVGICQASPDDRFFAYELSDYIPPSVDGAADSLYFYPANTQTPSFLLSAINWEVVTTNNGGATLDTLGIDITVNDGTTDVYTAFGYSLAVPTLTKTLIQVPGTYTPAATPNVNYTVHADMHTGAQVDVVASNDTLSYEFAVTDTIMARYDATSDGRIGIDDGTGGTIGVLFDIPTTAYATSATFYLGQPTLGDSVYAELYDWNGITPNQQIARSATYIITQANTTGVALTLPFIGTPVQLTPATYLVGIREHNANVSIFYSLTNWRPLTTWINIPVNGWQPSEAYQFSIVPFIDLNIWSQNMVSVPEMNNSVLSLYPNPANGEINITNPLTEQCKLTITDMAGKVVYSNVISGLQKEVVRTSEWSNGVYIAKTESNGNSAVSKVVVSH